MVEKCSGVQGYNSIFLEELYLQPSVTVTYLIKISNHRFVGSFRFIPNIATENIKFLGSKWTSVDVVSGELSTLNEEDMIYLWTVLIPKLVKRTVNMISTAIEKNPPVAVLN